MGIAKSQTTKQRHKAADRGVDLYETPPVATRALLDVERLPHMLWEASCGRGAIVKVLREYGHDVLATDLVDYKSDYQDAARFDFMLQDRLPFPGIAAIVQNPPFGRAVEFLRHSLKLCPRAYMLLRLQFLEGTKRDDLLEQLARVHVFKNRLPMMHRDGWTGPKATSTTAYGWFVFDRYHTGPTQLYRMKWLD